MSNPSTEYNPRTLQDSLNFIAEQQIVLRVPAEISGEVEAWLKGSGDMNVRFEIFKDKSGVLIVGNRVYRGMQCDLPNVVETMKTFDGASFYKAGDIGQVFVVEGGEMPNIVHMERQYGRLARDNGLNARDQKQSESSKESLRIENGFATLVHSPAQTSGLTAPTHHIKYTELQWDVFSEDGSTLTPARGIVREAEERLRQLDDDGWTDEITYELVSADEALKVLAKIQGETGQPTPQGIASASSKPPPPSRPIAKVKSNATPLPAPSTKITFKVSASNLAQMGPSGAALPSSIPPLPMSSTPLNLVAPTPLISESGPRASTPLHMMPMMPGTPLVVSGGDNKDKKDTPQAATIASTATPIAVGPSGTPFSAEADFGKKHAASPMIPSATNKLSFHTDSALPVRQGTPQMFMADDIPRLPIEEFADVAITMPTMENTVEDLMVEQQREDAERTRLQQEREKKAQLEAAAQAQERLAKEQEEQVRLQQAQVEAAAAAAAALITTEEPSSSLHDPLNVFSVLPGIEELEKEPTEDPVIVALREKVALAETKFSQSKAALDGASNAILRKRAQAAFDAASTELQTAQAELQSALNNQ